MKSVLHLIFICVAGLWLSGCASRPKADPSTLAVPGAGSAIDRVRQLSPELKNEVLALDPETVSDAEATAVLSKLPAPQVICIHGGLLRVKSSMNSFSEFLIGMGYPLISIQNPGNGEFAYGHYDDSAEIAGTIAWYYERDGLRPMIVGHSLGGIMTVRVLYELAGASGEPVPVWNPVTGQAEGRFEFMDPLGGTNRPVVGLTLPYASAAMAGGIARIIPGQWDMNDKLREIPDSVEDFTGYQKGMDMAGGDLMGFGSGNEYHALGTARVRNVRLPSLGAHWTLPYTKGLLEDEETMDWIHHYEPVETGATADDTDPEFGFDSAKVLWAADVWHSIKKHWVLELQRLIRAESESSK